MGSNQGFYLSSRVASNHSPEVGNKLAEDIPHSPAEDIPHSPGEDIPHSPVVHHSQLMCSSPPGFHNIVIYINTLRGNTLQCLNKKLCVCTKLNSPDVTLIERNILVFFCIVLDETLPSVPPQKSTMFHLSPLSTMTQFNYKA